MLAYAAGYPESFWSFAQIKFSEEASENLNEPVAAIFNESVHLITKSGKYIRAALT
jgi:hypothetical protein